MSKPNATLRSPYALMDILKASAQIFFCSKGAKDRGLFPVVLPDRAPSRGAALRGAKDRGGLPSSSAAGGCSYWEEISSLGDSSDVGDCATYYRLAHAIILPG